MRFWIPLLLLAWPGAAQAADEGGGFGHMIWEVGNLLLLAAILFYFARKPVLTYLSERRTTVRGDLEGSAQVLAEAERRLAEWEERLASLDAEVDEMRATSRKLAEAERERIVTDARQSAERIRSDALAAIDQEVRRARVSLREEASDLAIEVAERMLQDEVNADDRTRLVDEFVERIERSQTSNTTRGSA